MGRPEEEPCEGEVGRRDSHRTDEQMRGEVWWRWAESNRRRRGYEPRALTN
jgi:hypothetical protein